MIVNRQSRIPVPLPGLESFLTRARRRLRLPKDALTVCLVTDAEIARWNRAYRGKSGATDVLSFRANGSEQQSKPRRRRPARNQLAFVAPSSGDATNYLGDIAIAPAVAKRNAKRFARTLDDEMRILILHGILHLMGYDHETDEGQMERREMRLRRELRLA
jgi:probable rRNA maturation factor